MDEIYNTDRVDSEEANPRISGNKKKPKLQSFKVTLLDEASGKSIKLKIGGNTSSKTIADLIIARLNLYENAASISSVRMPIGVMFEDVTTPLNMLYSSLYELDEEARSNRRFPIVFNQGLSQPSSSSTPLGSSNTECNVLNSYSYFNFRPIGYIESCFPRKNGCPRQGILVPSSTAKFRLRPPISSDGTFINGCEAFEGIENTSHVWIIWIFHANLEEREQAFAAPMLGGKHFHTKIHPPRLGGKSIGVYATRSPHRLVPIGLTAAKLDKVEGDTLFLSGIDLIDGTPVLDIKPYIPSYDSIPDAIESASWIASASEIEQVQFSSGSLSSLQIILQQAAFASMSESHVKNLISEVLLSDPRSVYRKTKCKNETFGFRVEQFSVLCSVDEKLATVLSISEHQSENV